MSLLCAQDSNHSAPLDEGAGCTITLLIIFTSNLKRLRRLAILILQYWFLEAGLSIGELVPSAWQKSMFLLLIFSRLILILKYHFCLCEILVERRGPEWLAELNTDCHFPLLFIDIEIDTA